MIKTKRFRMPLLMALLLLFASIPLTAQVQVQCPCDRNGDGDCNDVRTSGPPASRYDEPALAAAQKVQCMHITGGDGFSVMADGRPMYMFGFGNVTGTPQAGVLEKGLLAAEWPAPTIAVDEGYRLYLTLTNVGMVIRPDLFDPHTVHFHGFPQSSTVFDGLPESGIAIMQGASLTYYYNLVEPGTFMYHCHVEATEHMQMGMLGNLYVRAAQNNLPAGTNLNGFTHQAGYKYVYNDGDGSTRYDVEFPLQLGGFDPEFHDASWNVQPLPFAMMRDRYPMINGRGYPDTVNPNPLPPTPENDRGIQSQKVSSLISVTAGQKVLLRISNLNITTTHTLISPSIPMRVVGIDAKELKAANGAKLHYTTNSVTAGGGMSADVILDTTGVPPGEYYLYASNLQYLANNDQTADLGGMMTKIVIN